MIIWILILFFGWLFMGWNFFLYIIIGAVIMTVISLYFSDDGGIWW